MTWFKFISSSLTSKQQVPSFEMNSKSFPFPHFGPFLPFFLLILLKSPAVSAAEEWSFNCQNSSTCRSINGNKVLFWTDNGTRSCVFPYLKEVNCEGSNPTIEILGAKYKVLRFDWKDHILIMSKLDIPYEFCSLNHPKIPPSSIYAMIPVTNCRNNSQNQEETNCSETEFTYKPIENRTYNPPPRGYCMLSTIVPISASLLYKLDGDWQKVAENIAEEFMSERKVIVWPQIRRRCRVLGYDLEFDRTRCYCKFLSDGFEGCPDPSNTEPAGSPTAAAPTTEPAIDNLENPKKKKTNQALIGVAIGVASFVAIILGCLTFYCLKRKNNKHELRSRECPSNPLVSESLSNQDLPPILFSNSFQTHSIPSYPSSNSSLDNTPPSKHANIQVFNYADLEKATADFNRSRELGDGGFGTVYYGILQDGREVAVKRLYEHNFKRVEQFINEVDLLAHLQHKNLVKLYGCTSRYSRGLLLVYEYIPNGTVADHLHGSRAKLGLLSWPIRLRIAIETANALVYLHRSEVIHRDVKTTNILLDNNFTVKVADFGLSRLFPTDVTHVSTAPQGTPGYVDPEYHQCYQLTTKSDVYSFGVVLVELISSLRAVDTDRKRQDINLSNMALSKIQSQALNELVDPKLGFDKNHVVKRAITSVAELAFRCLQQEKDMRPTMEEVVKELREIENDKFSLEMAKVVDIGVVGEDFKLSKRMMPSFSPNSVLANNCVRSS